MEVEEAKIIIIWSVLVGGRAVCTVCRPSLVSGRFGLRKVGMEANRPTLAKKDDFLDLQRTVMLPGIESESESEREKTGI